VESVPRRSKMAGVGDSRVQVKSSPLRLGLLPQPVHFLKRHVA
jgi:hypothetical protein